MLLHQIAKLPGMPSAATIYSWIGKHAEFAVSDGAPILRMSRAGDPWRSYSPATRRGGLRRISRSCLSENDPMMDSGRFATVPIIRPAVSDWPLPAHNSL
jgi:hypothetical protein